MTLNATSVFMLSQAVANRCFIPQRSGNIIVIASVAALRVGMQMKAAAYYSSKAAALHLTRASCRGVGPSRHPCQCDLPGILPIEDVERRARKDRSRGDRGKLRWDVSAAIPT